MRRPKATHITYLHFQLLLCISFLFRTSDNSIYVNKWRESSHHSTNQHNNRHGKRTQLQHRTNLNAEILPITVWRTNHNTVKTIDENDNVDDEETLSFLKLPKSTRNFEKRTETGFHLNDPDSPEGQQADENQTPPTESNTPKPHEEEEETGGKSRVKIPRSFLCYQIIV